MNFILPDIGEGIETISVSEILVKESQKIKANESILLVETDKASMEIPIDTDCTITNILVNIGDLISPGTTILEYELNETDNNQIYNLMHLNLISCILASQLFMNYCKTNNIQNSFIINISSGVSLKPIEGWGLYCISKAAVNMLASVIAEDSKRWQYPIQSISLNPGPMNTSMQKMIRGSEEKQNPIKSKFVKMHEDRELLDPKLIAKKIIGILSAKPFPNGEYINLLDN